MNGMLRDLLSERADAAGTPNLDLDELVADGERRVSRRRRAALGGTVAAVVLTVGASIALAQVGADRTSPPVAPPTTTPTGTVDVVPDTTGSRPLTYGLGATIHYGDRTFEASADGLFLVDGGLAILTGDDGRTSETRLLFTDGGEPVEIAQGIGRVTSGDVGSLLVWLDGDDVVIYDTRARSVLDRLPLNGRLLSNPITALEDAVYWHEYVEDTATSDGRDRLVRYDVSTGTRSRASEAEYQAEMQAAVPPRLVVGSADSKEPAGGFYVKDSQLNVTTGSGKPGPGFVAATGERLLVSVPEGYDGEALYLFQWLDDDKFALVASVPGVGLAPTGDLLVCRISAGECKTVASGEQDWLLPSGLVSSV